MAGFVVKILTTITCRLTYSAHFETLLGNSRVREADAMTTTIDTSPKILRFPEVRAMVGLSRNAIELRVKSGEFPAPLRLGGPRARALGWRRADVERWIEELTI